MFSLNESPKKKLDKERKEILINQQSKPQFHGSLILKTNTYKLYTLEGLENSRENFATSSKLDAFPKIS